MRPATRHALAAATAGLPLACAAADALLVHHIPQTEMTAAGVPKLAMAESTSRWAARAGLELRWVAVPFKRSLEELRRNAEPFSDAPSGLQPACAG